MSHLIFGCGYLGSRVVALWQQAGHEVLAVTRSAPRGEQLRARGVRPIVADVTEPESLRGLPAAETVLFAVGYDSRSGATIQQVYVDGFAAVLEALPSPPRRVIYVSSTGVYGQTDGTWVDEDSPCAPTRAGGQASLAAEQVLRGHPHGAGGCVLRMAGIYGPGRVPRVDLIRAGKAIPAPQTGFLNLIHVEDAAAVVVAAETAPQSLYCVSDGAPVVRRDYYALVAELVGAGPPTFSEPDTESHVAARATANKRIRNDRLRRDMYSEFCYPSCREGLAAILHTDP